MTSMIGTFAELHSGGPTPFVAKLIDWNPNTKSFLCKWLWRPQDIPASVLQTPRTVDTFSQHELLMCTADAQGADWNPRDALLRENVKVLSYDKWLQQDNLATYFYRQIYDAVTQQLAPVQAAESAGGFSLVRKSKTDIYMTINPDLRYFKCPTCAVLFDGQDMQKTVAVKLRPRDGPVAAECSSCLQGNWEHVQPPTDEKRKAVVDRILSALTLAAAEATTPPDSQSNLINLASAIEQCVFSDLGNLTKEYKTQARSLVFNLTDPKNPQLRAKVLSGAFPIWKLSRATADELASPATKQERQAEREKYYQGHVVLPSDLPASPVAGSNETSSPPRRRLPTSEIPANPPDTKSAERKTRMTGTAKTLLEELKLLKNQVIAERMRKFISSLAE